MSLPRSLSRTLRPFLRTLHYDRVLPPAALLPSHRRHRHPAATHQLCTAAPIAEQSRSAHWLSGLDIRVGDAEPFKLALSELDRLTDALLATVRVLQLPALDAAAAHLLSLNGKRIRPTIVILMARAAAVGAISGAPAALLPAQRRLAEITELIHAASLLHDDVIDSAATRRGAPSANAAFGNQLAVLAGDFLLARASVALARLRDCDVVERLATVIEHLVRGEVLQLRGADATPADGAGRTAAENDARDRNYHAPDGPFERYIAKTFFKTASLIANSSRAVCMLGGASDTVADAAYQYGEHVGMAFQLVDDLLDMTGSARAMGKPVCDDLRQGHATAPVLFALEMYPDEVSAMIERRFKGAGDIERAVLLVDKADGLGRTRELAEMHARAGVHAIVEHLQPSVHRDALINLAHTILTRDR